MSKILFVPQSIADVSSDWLKIASAKSTFDTNFTDIKYQAIGEEFGFASKLYRLSFDVGDKQQSVVLKLWDSSSRAGIGEVLFYQNFQDFPVRVPKCFGALVDEQRARAFVLLEDIQNSLQGDVLKPVSLDVAKTIAIDLAKLHASYLDHPKLNDYEWIADVSVWEPNAEWFSTRRKVFLERFPDKLTGIARKLFDDFEQMPALVNQVLQDLPQTLLHGDFHLDNILFEKQTTKTKSKPVYLDWSRLVKGPQAYNLAAVLFEMTALEHFDDVLNHYLNEFNAVAEVGLEQADLEKQIGAELLRLFARTTFGVARWQPEAERGLRIIEDALDSITKSIEFWYKRNSEYF